MFLLCYRGTHFPEECFKDDCLIHNYVNVSDHDILNTQVVLVKKIKNQTLKTDMLLFVADWTSCEKMKHKATLGGECVLNLVMIIIFS